MVKNFKVAARIAFPHGFHEIHRIVTCAPLHTGQCRKSASVWEQLSASNFRLRPPVSYGSILELYSLVGRIRSLKKQGGIRPIQIGFLWELDDQKHPRSNRHSQTHIQGIQKLLVDFPLSSFRDFHGFLAGYEAGQEYRIGNSYTAKNNACVPDRSSTTSARAILRRPQVVQQSTGQELKGQTA
jgi:hypothetical protein